MNKTNVTYHLIAIQIWLMASLQIITSQVPYNEIHREEALNNREEITLFTDRNIYAVNEQIYFCSFYRKNGRPVDEVWSKVLYVELVTASGRSVMRGKYYHDGEGSSGYLTIPEDALTGNYYLRAYTRWMRNFDPRYFCYIPLTIINPYKQAVLQEGDELSSVNVDRIRLNHRGAHCQTNKTTYVPGEDVQLELSRFGAEYSGLEEYCLTVVPAGLIDTQYAHIDINDPEMSEYFSFNYLPDIRGVSISGGVVNTEDQSPAPLTGLHFSLLGKQPDYLAVLSDEQGRFVLTIPERIGIQEFFVAYDPSDEIKREIRIDQDFSSDPIPFGTNPFVLTTEEKEMATRMVLNMQLSTAYVMPKVNPSTIPEPASFIPFYGKPKFNISIEEYIKLPTLTEFFVNLVPNVLVHYQRGDPYLEIASLYSIIALFPPLILIDQIPVFDQKTFLSLDPSKFDRIEVINEVFVKGEIRYGGIIIMTTKQGDMAGVDLPDGSYFFDYQTFHSGDLQAPDARFQTSLMNNSMQVKRIPDARNTLLWIDKISLGLNEKKTLKFRAASRDGEYLILVRGISSLGEIVYGVSTFKVEQK